MEIQIDSLLAGARRAVGTVVVIDVYRAFTTACVMIERGARRVLLTAEIGEAMALRDKGVGDCCVGEVGGKRPEGFDVGNSPHRVAAEDFTSRIPILSTRAGTVGIAAANGADRLYAASLVNAGATAAAIRRLAPARVTLVAMGLQGCERTDEDELCASYIRNRILGASPDSDALARYLRGCHESRKFGDPAQPHFAPEDLDLALQVDRVDFALQVKRNDSWWIAEPVTPETTERNV